jgi:cytochrome oxidase Cu insertion factor (SCO1/SenC/PrrC family)
LFWQAFIFTTCPDVCPLLTAKFAAIRAPRWMRKIKDYLLLSISTDPGETAPLF